MAVEIFKKPTFKPQFEIKVTFARVIFDDEAPL
jgi:hypothetical protein